MSAKKIITYTNPETKEVHTGTVTEIAAKLGITPQAMYKRLSTELSTPLSTINQESDTINQLSTTPEVDSVNPEPLNVDQETGEILIDTKPKQTKFDDSVHKTPCIHCKKPTFHRENGVAFCNPCLPKQEVKKILYQPPKCDLSVLDEGLAAAVQRCIDHNKGKYFLPPKRFNPDTQSCNR